MAKVQKIILPVVVIVAFLGFVAHAHTSPPNNPAAPSLAVSAIPAQTHPGQSMMNGQSTMPMTMMRLKDGTYTGDSADAVYGSVQVQAAVSGNRLADIKILQYPDSHDYSRQINPQALPVLKSEAISNQSASVDAYSGATYTSQAFMESLQSAINQAKG